MPESLPTGTVTFLFSDVEGSTRLWEDHHEEMKAALASHDKVVRAAIEDNEGHVFSTAGDAYSAAFGRPASAVRAAISAQAGLAGLTVAGSPMTVRMAIHTGSADERDGDYFGPAVNRVARLMSAGNGGQVLVSGATERLVQDTLPEGSSLDDLGEHRLKDLSRPERIFQLRHESFRGDGRPLRSLDAFPHNLPIQLTSFVGRDQEVVEITKLLGATRMVTLSGVGGAGKTRLAIQTGAEVLSRYSDGVWLVELAPLTDAGRIPATVMDVLGIEEKSSESPIDTLTRALAKREILLILDNCEHVVDPAARFAAAALGSGTGVSILATSREMLGVPGEYPFQVRSLASPDSLDDEVRSAMLRYPAVQLFAERGELARPGWRLNAENAESVVKICRRLDGMPLAIELAAARLRMMPAEHIASRLDDRFRLLTGGARTLLPRQQTLEAAIDWSFELLSDEEKTLFRRLSVFMGGFTLEAAEAVCGIDPLDEYAVFDHLGHLVDKSLVQSEHREDTPRYRLLETLRQYARQRLADSSEVESMRRGHAGYFLRLVEEAEPNLRGVEEAYWFGRLDDDLDNIRQAMTWALEAGEPQIAQAMAGGLYRYFMYRYRDVEGREWAEKALAASDEPTRQYAKALLAAGTLAQFALDQDASMKHLDQAIDLARSLDLGRELSAALNNRANVASGMGMSEEALRLHEEHLELDRRIDDKDGIIIGLLNMSSLTLDLGDAGKALELAQEALREAKGLGSERLVFHARLWCLGPLRELGELDRMDEQLELMREGRETPGVEFVPGVTDFWAALLHIDRDELSTAAADMVRALRDFRGMPDPYEQAAGVTWINEAGALILERLGEWELGAHLVGSADALNAEKGYVRGQVRERQLNEVGASLRSHLGDQEFERAYQSGRLMDGRDAHDALLAALEKSLQD